MSKTSLQFFISYSHKDINLKEKLLIALKSLSYEYNINDVWHDGEIGAGHNIDAEILDQLNNSDVILLLVSPYFLSSYYCIEVELAKAIKRMGRGECLVVPVMLSPCTLSNNLPFYNLKRLPVDGKPITNFKSYTNGCTSVTNGLKETLKKDFPDAIIKQKRRRKTSTETEYKDITSNTAYIELFKNGKKQPVLVSQELIFQIPKYHYSIHKFRTMMEQSLLKSKQLYVRKFKEMEKSNLKMTNEFRLIFLRLFLMDICSYTKLYITDPNGIKVHFRISKNDNYIGLIASTDNDDKDDLASDWETLMTPIPIYEGLIYHSYRLNAPLLKSLNPKLNYKGRNDKIWKDYVTFTFRNLDVGNMPSISYCISVSKKYYNVQGDILKILAYLNLGDIVEKFIRDYCTLCKKIDTEYDLNQIIKSA